MHRVLKNEKYLYEEGAVPYTQEQLEDPEFMGEETYKDVCEFIKAQFNEHGFTDNNFTLCFDDKEFQLRPDYKKRNSPEIQKQIKRIAQEKLLQIPETPRFHKVVGYGMEADDWVYTLRLKNTNEGKYTYIHANDCDLLCNIDKNTTARFYKAQTSNEITKDTWDVAINSVFRHELPYNTTWLYKVTVGDTSDAIPGVKGFGDKAFDKMIERMQQAGIPLHTLSSMNGFKMFLTHENGLKKYLNEVQYEQALEAWELVAPIPEEEAKERYAEAMSGQVHMSM